MNIIAVGGWQLAVGRWALALEVGCWRWLLALALALAVGGWRLDVGVGRWRLALAVGGGGGVGGWHLGLFFVEAEGDAACLVHETYFILVFAFTKDDGKAF